MVFFMGKKVVYRLPRKTFDGDKEIHLNDLEEFLVNENQSLKYKVGELKKEDIKLGRLKKDKDEFSIIEPSSIDLIKRYRRGAQIMTLKDAAPIIAKTGINKESLVIDAGTGSGSLASILANIVGEVHTVDINQDHVKVAKKNVEKTNLKNIVFVEKNILEPANFEKEKYDLFTLDISTPWNALDTANKVLKKGGYLVVYSPSITQIQKTVNELPKYLQYLETIEVIERAWKVGEKVLRPETKDHGHTGFLCFVRKL